jgi:hypothetical protein
MPPLLVSTVHRCCHQATTAATVTTTITVVKLTILHCQRKRQHQQHHQRTNGSTKVKTFASPDDLDLFNLSIVFEVCDVGQGNCTFFVICILMDESPCVLGRWWMLQ